MVNNMIHKIWTIPLKNLYLAKTNDIQYNIHPADMDIMKCLVSKGYYCSMSGGLYPVQGSNYCALALYFNDDSTIKIDCSIKYYLQTLNS